MATWNRRVVRHPNGDLAIHEVHYDDAGLITGWTETASEAVDEDAGMDGLRQSVAATYEQSCDALTKPILEAADLPGGAPIFDTSHATRAMGLAE